MVNRLKRLRILVRDFTDIIRGVDYEVEPDRIVEIQGVYFLKSELEDILDEWVEDGLIA